MAKLNIKLLQRLRTRFLRMRHQEHFNMAVWAHRNECGTAMCIAGHALDLQGYKTRPKRVPSCTGNLIFVTPDGDEVEDVSATAAAEMGIDMSTAQSLFINDETVTTPREAAARIQKLIENTEALTAGDR